MEVFTRMRLVLLLVALGFASAVDFIENHFFCSRSSEPLFLPVNKFGDGDKILKTTSLRGYRLTNAAFLFGVLWNPVRCALPKSVDHWVILSFFKEWTPVYEPIMTDILRDGFVFSSPRGINKPTDTPWKRKFEVSLTGLVAARVVSEAHHLKMDMYNSGFFAKVRQPKVKRGGQLVPGLVTLYFFNSENGNAVHQATIPLLQEFRYLALFSRYHTNCCLLLPSQ